jgi:hypothetical protein
MVGTTFFDLPKLWKVHTRLCSYDYNLQGPVFQGNDNSWSKIWGLSKNMRLGGSEVPSIETLPLKRHIIAAFPKLLVKL